VVSNEPIGGDDRESLIFTCAGAAYSGQVANRAGVDLAQAGAGSLFCITAVAAEIPGKLDRTANAGRRIVIDGCDDHCARKVIEKAGFPVDLHVEITTLGITKQVEKPAMSDDSRRVVEHVLRELD